MFYCLIEVMRVFLIRHGETEHNVEGGITGQLDIPLNEYGVEQAEKLAERLKNENFDAAYSSDLERTYKTTKIVSGRQNLHPEEFKEFREMDFGTVEGKPKEVFGRMADESNKERHFYTPPDGESTHEAGQRFLGKLEDLSENHENDKILVGGHSVALKATLMRILDLKGEYYGKLNLGNTSITELELEEGGWKLIRVNDTAHLE